MLSDNKPIRWMCVALQDKRHDMQSLSRLVPMFTRLTRE